MMYNSYNFYQGLYPFFFFFFIPAYNQEPPTLYRIMNSICNYGKDNEEHISLRKLAENSREKIFDFDYPLSEKVDKKEFEINILNKFMKRRIRNSNFYRF